MALPTQPRPRASSLAAWVPAAALGLCLALGCSPAAAQLVLPGGQGGGAAAGATVTPDGRPSRPVDPGPPKPRALGPLKPIAESEATGVPLAHNGLGGRMLIERAGDALRARITLAGRSTARAGDTCTVELGGAEGVALARVSSAGLTRVSVDAPSCPMRLDLLSGAVLVTEPKTPCTFEAQACRADVAGLWGPAASTLAGRGPELERARAAADASLRDAYRALAARFDRAGASAVISEQAAFSSERATACRDYDREAQFSFCATRFTEGRLAAVRARLSQLETSAR